MVFYPTQKETDTTQAESRSESWLKIFLKSELWETSIAGPGFINFKLSPDFFAQLAKRIGRYGRNQKVIRY